MRCLLSLCLLLASLSAQADAPQYQIRQIKDNVYRFTAGTHHAPFMVTEAGIFVTDPINPAAATWLKAELEKRFDVPVRYMAYSHNHIDHTAGGEVMDGDGVTVIAHELAAEDLRMTRAPTAMPEVTFKEQLSVRLGDSEVELRYYGNNNGRGNVSMRFQPANVVFVADWVVIGRMPYQTLPGYDINGMIRSTRALLSEPAFDVFVGGHASIGTRADVERYLAYLEALYAAVRDGMLLGKNLETLQAEIKLPAYSDLLMYEEWLPLNIEGVYKSLVEDAYFKLRPDIDYAR